jgi:hypothetical protein
MLLSMTSLANDTLSVSGGEVACEYEKRQDIPELGDVSVVVIDSIKNVCMDNQTFSNLTGKAEELSSSYRKALSLCEQSLEEKVKAIQVTDYIESVCLQKDELRVKQIEVKDQTIKSLTSTVNYQDSIINYKQKIIENREQVIKDCEESQTGILDQIVYITLALAIGLLGGAAM